MMSRKIMGYILLVAFAGLTFYLAFQGTETATAIASGSGFGILIYFLSDFKNWVIIFSGGLIRMRYAGANGWKGYLGGALISIAADIVSFPRMLLSEVPSTLSARASFDYLTINKMVELGLTYSTAWWVFYVILPLILMYFALELLGVAEFVRKVIK